MRDEEWWGMKNVECGLRSEDMAFVFTFFFWNLHDKNGPHEARDRVYGVCIHIFLKFPRQKTALMRRDRVYGVCIHIFLAQ